MQAGFHSQLKSLMDESQRQAYLNALGIQQYFPRNQMAGANPSARIELSVVSEEDTDAVAVVGAEIDTKLAPEPGSDSTRSRIKPAADPSPGDVLQAHKIAENESGKLREAA